MVGERAPGQTFPSIQRPATAPRASRLARRGLAKVRRRTLLPDETWSVAPGAACSPPSRKLVLRAGV